MANKQLSFRIDSVTFELLETYTKILGRPRSRIILEALKLYLNEFDNEIINKDFFSYGSIIDWISTDYKNWDYIQASNLWECGYTKILDPLTTRIIKSYFYSQQLMFSDDLTYFFPIEIIDSQPVQIIFNRNKINTGYINKIIIKEINKII